MNLFLIMKLSFTDRLAMPWPSPVLLVDQVPSNQTADNSKRSKLIWRLKRKWKWLSKRVHNTWKLFKSYGIFNSDITSCLVKKSFRVEIQICEGDTLIVPIIFIDLA